MELRKILTTDEDLFPTTGWGYQLFFVKDGRKLFENSYGLVEANEDGSLIRQEENRTIVVWDLFLNTDREHTITETYLVSDNDDIDTLVKKVENQSDTVRMMEAHFREQQASQSSFLTRIVALASSLEERGFIKESKKILLTINK